MPHLNMNNMQRQLIMSCWGRVGESGPPNMKIGFSRYI